MAKYLWGTLCARAVVDQFRNSVSIQDIIEEIRIPDDLPAPDASNKVHLLPGEMTVFSYWERSDLADPERAKGRYVLVAPDDTTLATTELDIDLIKGQRSTMLGALPGLPIVSEGRYTFRVEQQKGSRWFKVGEIQYDVDPGSAQSPRAPCHTGPTIDLERGECLRRARVWRIQPRRPKQIGLELPHERQKSARIAPPTVPAHRH